VVSDWACVREFVYYQFLSCTSNMHPTCFAGLHIVSHHPLLFEPARLTLLICAYLLAASSRR
jgi:hypothetical protein